MLFVLLCLVIFSTAAGNIVETINGNLNIDENGKNEIIETAHEDKEQDVVFQQGRVTVPGSRPSIANNIIQHDNFFLSDFSPPQTMKKRFDFNNDDMLAATVLSAIYRQEVESISQALGETEDESHYKHQYFSNPVSRKWKLLSSNKSHYFKTDGNNKGPITFKQYSGTSTSVLSAVKPND